MGKDQENLHSLGRALSKANRLLNNRIMEEFSDYEIGTGQLYSLLALYEEEGRCQNEICEIHNLDKAAVGRSLKKLEDKNFVKRKPDPNDKRRKRVYLREKADSFRPECMERLKSIESDIASALTSKEKEIFGRAIEKICQSLKCDPGEKYREGNDGAKVDHFGG